MKKLILAFLLLIPTTYAAEDVCCVLKSVSGDSVQTFVWVLSSDVCKAGGTYQGKQMCAAVKDPENTYCGSDSSKQDRCQKCGYFWSGKECLTENPVEKAKKELKEEEKKKEKEKPAADVPASEKPATVKEVKPSTSAPAPQAAPQDPDGDQVFNRKNKSKSEGIESTN
jgi:hypothetical protein